MPMENERGREMVEEGALCERKNGRGVDTNRNWEVHWGFKEKDYDPSEEFPGEKPFRWGAPAAKITHIQIKIKYLEQPGTFILPVHNNVSLAAATQSRCGELCSHGGAL